MLCERCEVWEISEGDLRCGWCGLDLFGLEVKSTIRLYVHADNSSSNIETTHHGVLTNLSRSRLAVSCDAAPDWLIVTSAWPSVVEPGTSLDLALRVDVRKLGGSSFREGAMILGIAVANHESETRFDPVKIKVEVSPLPGVKMKPLTIYSGEPSDSAELEMEVWSPIVVESILFDPPWLRYDQEPALEPYLGDQCRLHVTFDSMGQTEFVKQTMSFSLRVQGIQEPITGQFEIAVRKPPVLKIVEARDTTSLAHEIIPGDDSVIEFVLNNEGEQDLKIDGLRITQKDPGNHFVTIRADKEMIAIPPGKQERLRLRAKAALEATAASCWFDITFISNDPEAKHNSINLWIRVVDVPYPDFIALDFGTTDSAVAILDETSARHMNLLLEPGLLDRKIYSNIFFKNYVADRLIPYAWCIGTEAKLLGAQTANRGRFVKAIKTKVGTGYREVIPFDKKGFDRTLEPEEIIRFIMMDLLGRTRSALRKRPTRFILSVPTRFSLRRKEILKETFRGAAESLSLGLDAIEMVDESLAAGLFYFLMRGPKDNYICGKESYTAMIVDFGGGTTDATVFRVQQRRHADGNVDVEDIEVIGASGDATLGGEEISLEIAQLLAARFLNRRIDPVSDSGEIRKLEDEAEAVKLAVSELLRIERLTETISIADVVEHSTALLLSQLVYLRVGREYSSVDELRRLIESYLQDDTFELPVESNDFLGQAVKIKPAEVVEIFEQRLRKLKRELESLLRRVNQLPVDVLLLAGQSSQFPIVKEVFEGLANHIDFVKDPSDELVLKECVSLGALYYSFYLNRDLNLTIRGAERVWTRVGKKRFVGGRIVFQELIPWGSEPPGESEPFKLTKVRDVTTDGRLQFIVEENLSMGEAFNLVPLGSYELQLKDTAQSEYTCKLKVGAKGEIEAFCFTNDQWQKMEFKL